MSCADDDKSRKRGLDLLATTILTAKLNEAGIDAEMMPTYTGDDPEVVAKLGLAPIVCIKCGAVGHVPAEVVEQMGIGALCPDCARGALGG